MRQRRLLTLADMAWLPEAFIVHGMVLHPVVRTMIGQERAMGGWYGREFLGFGAFQVGYWADVGDVGVWLVPPAARAHPLALLRLMQETLAEWETTYHIRRWQSMVLAGWPEGERLITLCHFNYEGTLRACEPGRDYGMYGRIRKG